MHRRNFIHTTGLSLASLLAGHSLFAAIKFDGGSIIEYPSSVAAIINNKLVTLEGSDSSWSNNNVAVHLIKSSHGLKIEIVAANVFLSAVTLTWRLSRSSSAIILNDHWERTYGDVCWHAVKKPEVLPWYFMEYNNAVTTGFGVKTGTASFCSWNLTEGGLQMTMDTRCGGSGVALGNRKLAAAEIVTLVGNKEESPFNVTRRFARMMCDEPRMPKQPVYGINDWYFSYGNNSAKLILEHTSLMAPLAGGLMNRPFSVIDAGWFKGPPAAPNDCCWGDRMDDPEPGFGDMHKLANDIRNLGMRPGIWTRPLCGSYKDANNLMLPLINGREAAKPVLDPTIPENLERIKSYFTLYKDWGYELVKFDFTTNDLFGKWGFEMLADGAITSSGWRMNDLTKTNAEIVLQLYKTIREAAGETYILSCNTISHLSAGLFEINRIGDDTSGNEWGRTRKMGVNTLAFRGATHGAFYATDADCVGLTTKVPWAKNKQWMELLAGSGTPLFISAQPDALGDEQKQAIKICYALAATNLPVGEPLDWMENRVPKKWKLNGQVQHFDWD